MKTLRTIATLSVLAAFVATLAPVGVFAATPTPCANPVKIATWRGCEPDISTEGTVKTYPRSAVVSASFTANGAYYKTSDVPLLSIQYGTSQSEMYQSTSSIKMFKDDTLSFALENIKEGTPVYYRARLKWAGGEKFGDSKPVVWNTSSSQYTGVSTTDGTSTAVAGSTTGNGSTTTATTNPTYSLTPAGTTASTGFFGGLFGTKSTKTTATTTTSRFKNVDEKSGLKLAIDDGNTQVHQGDTVTLKVRYENNSNKSYSNGTIDIYVPEQYTIETTNKGIHDKVNNMVAISLRDFPAGGFGTAIIIAKATGGSKDLDQAVSQAGLKVGGMTLAVADIDEYISGTSSSSGLGASVSGAKFVPGTLIGWIVLLIVLAGIVIIGRRYFVKKDY